MKHWLSYFYFLQLCNFLIKLILPWLYLLPWTRCPNSRSPALPFSPYCQLPVRHWYQKFHKLRTNLIILFLLQWVLLSYSHFTNPAGIQVRTFSITLYFSPTFICQVLKVFILPLNLLYIFIPIINSMTHIWVFAIGSLTAFLIPPSILLSFCYASSP